MRSDPNRSEDFKASEYWAKPIRDFKIVSEYTKPDGGKGYRSNSFSGNERNRLVIRGADGFVDRSLVSGVDCKEDARSFAVLDLDGDGWLDIALPSVNGPRLRLFRNRFGDFGEGGRVVNVMLRGSHDSAQPDKSRSNRDAVGAVLTVVSSKHTRVFRKSIGEGLAAQNTGRIRITLARDETLEKITVRWPSGKTTEIAPAADQSAIEISE